MPLILDLVLTLKRVSIFDGIPDHILAEIADIIEIVELPIEHTFIKEGTLGDALYIVKTGTVRVHRADLTLVKLGQNDIVGELAVLSPIDRTASVTTETPTVLYKIYQEYFIDLLTEQPEVMRSVFTVLVRKLHYLNNQYVDKINI